MTDGLRRDGHGTSDGARGPNLDLLHVIQGSCAPNSAARTADVRCAFARVSQYTRRSFRSTVGVAQRARGVQEQWVDSRGDGRRIVTGGSVPKETVPLNGRVDIASRIVPFGELAELGRNPERLDRIIEHAAGAVRGLSHRQARAFATYRVLEDVLLSGAPAQARAAALRQLATTDGLRREGSNVTLTIGAVRFALTLKDTSIVGIERRLLHRSAQVPGTPRTLDRWQLVGSGSVERVGARP